MVEPTRTRRCLLLVAALVLAGSGPLSSPDRIELAAGGALTPGLDITIDLSSGEAVRRSQRRSTAPDAGRWVEQRRTLTAAELSGLRAVVRRSLAAGFETKQCLAEERRLSRRHELAPPRPPAIDSISELFIRFDGQQRHGPSSWLCESHAYKLLWTETVNLASRTHFTVPVDEDDR